jgi:hypothetical protein
MIKVFQVLGKVSRPPPLLASDGQGLLTALALDQVLALGKVS